MKTFHGNLNPKPPTQRDRDASFSSYPRPDKPITCQPHHHTIGSGLRRGLEDSTSELSIFDAHKYFNEVTHNNDVQKVPTSSSSSSRVSPVVHVDMERNIPERCDIPETTRYPSASSSVDGYANIRSYRARSFHAATPTASSEASWNSQTGLLSHPPGAISVSIRNPQNPIDPNKKHRASLSKPIWLFRRKCPCTGKKSVQVKENTLQPKTHVPPPSPPPPPPNYSLNIERHNLESKDVPNHITPNNWVGNQTPTFVATKSQRFNQHRLVTSVRPPFTDGFTFPVLNTHSTSSTAPKPHPNGVVEDDPPRDSLEVFRPPEDTVEPESLAVAVSVDDAASDASSDLFEIDSFSTATQSTYPTVYRRGGSIDSFDEGSINAGTSNGFFFGGRRSMDEGSTTTTAAYEPSEASIEWSVTTAEGHEECVGGGGSAAEKWKRKGGNGLLVSCRSEKAVSIGPEPVKCGGVGSTCARHVIVNGFCSNTTNSYSKVGSGCVSVSGNKPPLARSHSHHNTPRVSPAFAT